jgi:hypothetical protein
VSIVLDLQPANAVANKKKVVVSVGERGQWLCNPARCAALHWGSERDPSTSSICSSAGSMAISHDVGAPLSLRLGGVELLETRHVRRIQHHAGEDRPQARKRDCRTDAPGLVPVRETRAMLTARKLVQGCSRPPSERPRIHPIPSHDGASRSGALIRLNRHGAVATLHTRWRGATSIISIARIVQSSAHCLCNSTATCWGTRTMVCSLPAKLVTAITGVNNHDRTRPHADDALRAGGTQLAAVALDGDMGYRLPGRQRRTNDLRARAVGILTDTNGRRRFQAPPRPSPDRCHAVRISPAAVRATQNGESHHTMLVTKGDDVTQTSCRDLPATVSPQPQRLSQCRGSEAVEGLSNGIRTCRP